MLVGRCAVNQWDNETEGARTVNTHNGHWCTRDMSGENTGMGGKAHNDQWFMIWYASLLHVIGSHTSLQDFMGIFYCIQWVIVQPGQALLPGLLGGVAGGELRMGSALVWGGGYHNKHTDNWHETMFSVSHSTMSSCLMRPWNSSGEYCPYSCPVVSSANRTWGGIVEVWLPQGWGVRRRHLRTLTHMIASRSPKVFVLYNRALFPIHYLGDEHLCIAASKHLYFITWSLHVMKPIGVHSSPFFSWIII